jgi:vancomycin resistance protein YoaR
VGTIPALRLEAGVTQSSTYYLRRRRQARVRRIKRLSLVSLLLLVVVVIAVSIVYAGSPGTLAKGLQINGVDVGGLSTAEATKTLEQRSQVSLAKPVDFVVDGHRFRVKASELGLTTNWAAAVAAARHQGDGFGPIRGFRRMKVRVFGQDVSAHATYDAAKLGALLGRIGSAVDEPHHEAAVVLHGLHPAVVQAKAGRILDRDAAGQAIVGSLAAFGRGNAVPLPTRVDEPKVTGPMLARAAAQARLAVSAPVTLVGVKRLRIPRWKIALALELPKDGATRLGIGGPGADALFKNLQKQVNTKAHDAQFVVTSGGIRIQPSVDARVLDVPKTAEGLLAAAFRTTSRSAPIVVASSQPKRATADAQAMGITGLVSSYTTSYGGVPNRIHNVEVVSHLVDNTLIPPHKEFSFNGTTGERNAAKGLLEAPVIINGELENGLGGGTCQVSTTVFNAAYEAGLPITARTNHALYISHYPQGRDATVNYPDTDLKFVNDSDNWLLLRTFVSSSTLTVNLYGTPLHRRVESEVAPLRTTGPVPEKVTKDPELLVGKKVVDHQGSPPLATSVTRRVYNAKGKLLYEATFYSSYVGDKSIIRQGTKPKPKPVKIDPASFLPEDLVPTTTTPATTTTP